MAAADDAHLQLGEKRRASTSADVAELSPAAVGAWWRAGAAEALGTALLVSLGCAELLVAHAPSAAVAADPLRAAITAGTIVAALVQCLDHISGAMYNPTVLLAAWLRGRLGAGRAVLVLAAQLLGALGGAGLLAAGGGAGGCVTRPADGVGPLAAAALEALCGGVLALANCAHWDSRARHLLDSWPLRVGTVVAAMTLAVGPLTGASMNPARSLGPALCSQRFEHHWVYWLGPLGGSLAATLAYGALWPPPPPAPAPAPMTSSHRSAASAAKALRLSMVND